MNYFQRNGRNLSFIELRLKCIVIRTKQNHQQFLKGNYEPFKIASHHRFLLTCTFPSQESELCMFVSNIHCAYVSSIF